MRISCCFYKLLLHNFLKILLVFQLSYRIGVKCKLQVMFIRISSLLHVGAPVLNYGMLVLMFSGNLETKFSKRIILPFLEMQATYDINKLYSLLSSILDF